MIKICQIHINQILRLHEEIFISGFIIFHYEMATSGITRIAAATAIFINLKRQKKRKNNLVKAMNWVL